MSAPALIALAHGSRDPRSARTVRDIVAITKRLRPDLTIEVAFLDHVRPDIDTVVERLVAKRRHSEFVVVPLLLIVGVSRTGRRAACRSSSCRRAAGCQRSDRRRHRH
ncbi:MAG: CbiX/SirB N-terminal domain-containing protein [Nocardioidaceae bacterium]